MSYKKTIAILISVFCYSLTQAQEIKSERSYLPLNNLPKKVVVEELDEAPPEVKIISPAINVDEKFISSIAEINIIGKATDISGVSTVIVNSQMREVSDEGIFNLKILLEPGENEIIIITMDKKDNFKQSKYVIEYVPPQLTFAEKVKKESKYYALIIGVSSYEDTAIPDLANPVKDAQSLYEVLLRDYTFDEENILLVKDAKRADIIQSFDALSSKITPSDNLLIFYAGHGWWDEKSNNGFWLPSDAKKDSKADWFRNSTLVDYLKEVQSKHTLLIADACFGGSIFQTRTAFTDAPKAIEQLYNLNSRKAMTSGTLTEVPDRSAFMKYLVSRLNDNTEKYLNSEQLFSSFRNAVINNSDVIPQFGEIRNVGDQGGDFIFIKR